MIKIIFLLLSGHAIADYALQNQFMADFKSRHAVQADHPLAGIWIYVLGSHALIHGVFVLYVTQSLVLGIAETVAHALIDFGKCEKWFGIHVDQCLHIFCKMIWLAIWAMGAA